DQCRVFSQTQAGSRLGPRNRGSIVSLELFKRRQAGHENGRLTDHRRVEPLRGAVPANFGKVIAEDFRCLIIKGTCSRQVLCELPAHANGLSALAGKEKRGLRHLLSPASGGGQSSSLTWRGPLASSWTMVWLSRLRA